MIGSGKPPSKISEINKLIEGLQGRLLNNNASDEESEFLSRTLEELKARLKELYVGEVEGKLLGDGCQPGENQQENLQKNLQENISEQKRAYEALRNSEAELKLVADGVPLLISHVSSDLKYLFVNQPYADWFHLPKEKIIGRHISEILSPEGYEESKPCIKKVLSGEKATYNLVVQRDGLPHSLDVAFIPQLDEKGVVRSYYTITQDITERKRIEDELRRSEEKSRHLIKYAPTGIYEVDFHGPKFKDVNDVLCQYLGYTREELLSMNPLDLLDDKSKIIFQERIKKKLAGEEIDDSVEYAVKTKAGREYYVILRMRFTYKDGKPEGAVVIAHDVTERRRTEEALRCSKERFDFAMEATRDGLWDWDIQSGSVYYSPGYFTMLGYAADEFEPRVESWLGLVHPDDRENALLANQDCIEGRCENFEVEFRMRTRDGDWKWILGRGRAAARDSLGKAIRLVGTHADITERKQAEQALKESNQRFRDAIDNFPNVFVIYDADRRIQFVNSKGLDIMGLLEQDMIGRKDEEIFPPEMINSYLPALKRAVEIKMPQTIERTRTASMGGQVVIIDIIPLLDESGSIRRILGLSHDITERKRMEEDLRKARDELELRVAERTAELSLAKEDLEIMNEELQVELEQHRRLEAELVKAKEAAEEASRAKAAFMANMSHELRTPMNAVLGMTSILLEEPLIPEHRDFIETIRNSGSSLLALINDVLDFSKLDREKTELELQIFDLRRCIEEAIDLVAAKASEKGLDLAYIFEKNAPEAIVSDPTRLRQVLANLLGNAVKFTDRGDIVVVVSVDTSDHEVHFKVTDTGIGIPQDQTDKLFLPFSQVESSLKRNYDGTGLGLAISKKLVEMMGGQIWAESEAGIGSTFHFTIKAETAPDLNPQKPSAHPETQFAGKSALIVDDSKAIRKVLSRQAYLWGMIPMVAATGQDALDLIGTGGIYDVVILDMNLSGKDGITLAKEIRKRRIDLPLIALTSIGQRPSSELFVTYITKPIKPAHLHNTLACIFSGEPAGMKCQSQATDQISAGPLSVNSLRILLAEDNVSSQKVALEMLRKLGYRADIAANGVEVLQALERQSYDVILMDLKMPEMDGLEATRCIRERWPVAKQPRIIAITAYALEGDRDKCLVAGMDGYISKPVEIRELEDVLNKFFSNRE